MKTNHLSRILRWSALAVMAAGFGVWSTAGARIGWTQTSVVTMQHDELTGIDYPVRAAAFRPGVEIPLLATATAAMLGGLAWAAGRRVTVRASS
jgi:hypothetical protein